ncbi:terminase small subunit [Anaerococcus sp.]|uniref:terminase small subunit n=1 Tax=Anaerococcus sp. TaxID=1872515 RepID=UPI002A912C05|nr:terminase small subunit [Anaerococcus sp.]MDY6127425.1 terminase small subunit [Anaerococcus sp.]
MKKLTIKQKKFADEYIISGNAYQAALKAGYSENYAKNAKTKMVDKGGKISAYINKRLEEIDSEKIVSQKEIMELLSSIARGESTEQTLIGVGEGRQEVIETRTTDKDRIKAMDMLMKRFGMNYSDLDIEKQQTQIRKTKTEIEIMKGISEEVEDLDDIDGMIYGKD